MTFFHSSDAPKSRVFRVASRRILPWQTRSTMLLGEARPVSDG